MTLLPTYLAAVWDIVQGLVMGLFILSGFILTVVVLLQEGKGGGIAGAFGGAGAEAFGVKAGTVNRFTAYVGAAFLALALIHAGIASRINQPTDPERRSTLSDDYLNPVIDVTPGGTTPGGSTPPAAPGTTPGGAPPDGAKPPEPATPPVEKPAEPPPPGPTPAPAPEQPKEPAPVPPGMGG